MAQQQLKAAILIVSDTAASDPSTDKSAPVLKEVFGDSWQVIDTSIVPDDVDQIQNHIKKWTDSDQSVNCLVTSGGTGFAVKDKTPEAVNPLIEKHAPGLIHAMLAPSLQITPFAMMARPVAGVRRQTIIVTLPGSPKGAKENLEAIIKLLPHACTQAAGANSREIHAGGIKKLEKEAGISSDSRSEASHGHPKAAQHSHHHHHHHHHHDHGHGHQIPRAHTHSSDRPVPNDPGSGPTQRHRKSPYPMISVTEALSMIKEQTPAPKVKRLAIRNDSTSLQEQIVGHVLAEDIAAPENVPAFRASIVDGYAIHVPSSHEFSKGVYTVSAISHAQASNIQALQEGTVARITTGAPLPPGSNAVVMVEDTTLETRTEDGLEEKAIAVLTSEMKAGENVREIGSDVKKGDVILHAGQAISAIGGEFGLLASVGVQEASVYHKAVVGVLSTGDEIIAHTNPKELTLGEVRDTNRPTLLSAIRGCGFQGVDLGIAKDKPGALEEELRAAFRQADVVITTGGVSMGELDLLKPTIERALGGTIHFGRVSMKPGKPTTFATVEVKDDDGHRVKKVLFGLPGNPASAVVTFHLFVLPALHQMSGIAPIGLPKVKVVIGQDITVDTVRNEYHRVVITAKADGRLHAMSTGGQRSSRIGSFKQANGLLCLPLDPPVLKAGTMVDALLMAPIVSQLV